eukprot:CAMPEP_0194247928 /NCGR_PEP_ID=MMETSP0158-20130606/17234_1 /TAXON_ID=33649 /ORGANISM="Thalassionema nitzschioides, Strain L26-B" /LENGTH=560 /DNA_ID=CAMNT_0038984083 /DNA_START=64 /DNA_END=1746 /DNA_ORIENTATION=+
MIDKTILFAIALPVVLSDRNYNDLVFTAQKCQDLGMAEYFESCAVLELCTTPSSRMLNTDEGGAYEGSLENVGTITTSAEEDELLFEEEVLQAEVEEETKSTHTTQQQQQQQVNSATYGYRVEGSTHCSWPGPIMRLKRGEKHGLFLKGNNGNSKTNLHFHGLHIQEFANGDWVYRTVQGEDNLLVYELDLQQHAGGTYWYHSHVHGSSWDQVKGGAFGMIIVNDNGHDVGTKDANVLTFLNTRSQEKVLILDDSHNQNQFYANGLEEETLIMVKDSWYRLRILTVGVDSYRSEIDIQFDDSSCQVHTLAYDGIFRFQVPNENAQSRYKMSPASRLDVAVRCSANANIRVQGNAVAKIQVVDGGAATASATATPFENGTNTWSSTRLEYIKDLRSSSKATPFEIRVDETNINGINEARHKPICHSKGVDFDYGSIQEWKLNGIATHPFHVHTYPMQIVSKGCAPHHEVGEYYDTIIAPDADIFHNQCIVRLYLIDKSGPTTVHCHLFEHAEHGAQTYFNVVTKSSDDNNGVIKPPTCIGTCDEPIQSPLKCSDQRKMRYL